MRQYPFLLLIIISLISACQPVSHPQADLILVNGDVWTANDAYPGATAFAVVKDKIAAVGQDEEILKWKGRTTKVIDAKGQFVTPGFIDSHVHFITGGLNLSAVQLREAQTIQQFITIIKAYKAGHSTGRWITGGEWDHESWGGVLPQKEWIDSVTQDVPVFVRRLDGHMGLANSAALKLAGIDEHTSSIMGGEIIRDSEGKPTGLLKDNAMNLVLDVIPPPTEQEFAQALDASMNYVSQNGVTSVHHVAGTAPEGYLAAFRSARRDNRLKTRIYVLMPLSNWKELKASIAQNGSGDEWLKIGGLKGFVDGSLGAHTAAFNEPYTDQPTDRGIFVTSKDSLEHWIKNADEAHLQVAVHAIGDAAIHFVLNTFEATQQQHGNKDQRFRIEHAQHIAPADIPRLAELNIIASMQPYHAIDDGRWAENVIGAERIKTTYAFKSLFDSQATVAFGSDWFVAPPSVIEGIYAAVTRQTLDGKHPTGWVPEQKISIEQALSAYTINAAYASFEEDIKGSIEVGKLADFVVLDQSLFKVTPAAIKDVKVLKTFVGGELVFARE